MIRISNKWAALLGVNLGSPIGEVRLPKTELEVDFNDLKLSKRSETMARDLPAEEPKQGAPASESDAAPAQPAEPELALADSAEEASEPVHEPTAAQPKGAAKKKEG